MSQKRLYGIRGATGVENTKESIIENVGTVCRAIFSDNKIKAQDIVSIQFTMTADIDEYNAAAALRSSSCGIDVSECALFCAVEPQVKTSLPRIIRVLVTAYLPEKTQVKNIYMNRAA